MFCYILIAGMTVLAIGAAVTVSLVTGAISLLYAFLAPLFCLIYCALLLGIFDLIIRFLPEKIWDSTKKPFLVDKKEITFYEKLKIRRWKDTAVPDWGGSAGFSKKSLKSSDPEYLKRFLRETCQGEALHAMGGIFAITVLLVFPVRDWYFVVPILLTDLFINLLPCLIQRYNRYRLLAVYHFVSAKSATRKNGPIISEIKPS